MRIYRDFPEARNEIQRDLAELGVKVHTETMQAFDISDDPDFLTKELTNYDYQVLKPDYNEIEGVHERWVNQEWADRLAGGLNPGLAWRERRDVWDPLRVRQGVGKVFSYTYSERMGGPYLQSIVDELQKHPHSRQLYLPVWSQTTDYKRRGVQRVPCSLGYWFIMREGALHMTYMMRSCDLMTHYPNDIALASIMQTYIAKQTDYDVGTFTHWIGSLHCYQKDVEDVF